MAPCLVRWPQFTVIYTLMAEIKNAHYSLFCVRGCVAVVMAAPDVRVLEPEFNAVPTKMTYTRGDMARLFCSVSHLGERTVSQCVICRHNDV